MSKTPLEQLDAEIAAYEAIRERVEAEHPDEWVVVHGGEVAGFHSTLDQAADDAVSRFGRGPYLIRQVGAPPMTFANAFTTELFTPIAVRSPRCCPAGCSLQSA